MILQGMLLPAVGNIAKLHVCTGTGTACSTVTLQRYMFLQVLVLPAVGNIEKLHVCTGTGTVCSTVTFQSYMIYRVWYCLH